MYSCEHDQGVDCWLCQQISSQGNDCPSTFEVFQMTMTLTFLVLCSVVPMTIIGLASCMIFTRIVVHMHLKIIAFLALCSFIASLFAIHVPLASMSTSLDFSPPTQCTDSLDKGGDDNDGIDLFSELSGRDNKLCGKLLCRARARLHVNVLVGSDLCNAVWHHDDLFSINENLDMGLQHTLDMLDGDYVNASLSLRTNRVLTTRKQLPNFGLSSVRILSNGLSNATNQRSNRPKGQATSTKKTVTPKKTARRRQKQKRPINVGKLQRAWHPYEQGKKQMYPMQDQSRVQMMQQEKGQRG